ncbi:hypothetical protein JOF35_005230 [Streptomyces demainii]|uniref:Uncharacterized protein n=1 Tax=Streptomyces demainii TaxID=588122 RepID=A0ABT9KWY7_9ACTN|nr:hypothetical protein [Streptomyces demainii]
MPRTARPGGRPAGQRERQSRLADPAGTGSDSRPGRAASR